MVEFVDKNIAFGDLNAFISRYCYVKNRVRRIEAVDSSETLDTRLTTDPGVRDRQESLIAVDVAYSAAIQNLVNRLINGYSVLQICDKGLNYAVSEWVRVHAEKFKYIVEHVSVADASRANGRAIIELLNNLRLQLSESGSHRIVIIDHLDLMTLDLKGNPAQHGSDIAYWLSEYRNVPVLAFTDPTMRLPKLIEDLFAEKQVLPPLDRASFHMLLRREEAQCLAYDTLRHSDRLRLYQYASGLNAIQFRRLMRMVASEDSGFKPLQALFPGESAESENVKAKVDQVYSFIRKMTINSEIQVPMVHESDLQGYKKTREDLKKYVIYPFQDHYKAETDADLARTDAMVPKGVILYGPPRNGKTEFAKWLANMIQAPLLIIRGPELKNKFVGETERQIRDTFATARKTSPSVILIDEIDALTPARDTTSTGVELSMVAQFLTEMDGVGKDESILIIGTTNRLDAVDPAFKAPGRFGVLVKVGYPQPEDRYKILALYSDKMKIGLKEDDINCLVTLTEGDLNRDERKQRVALRNALVASLDENVRRDAGQALQAHYDQLLYLDQMPQWSCDHLRGICQTILVETEWAKRNHETLEIHTEEFLTHIVESVRSSFSGEGSAFPPITNLLGSIRRRG
jgi:transitional endoplasmic reticulum ATPase